MDTPKPTFKVPRRKSKKVIMKKDKHNASSAKQMSMKKLRAAINTSFNSTVSVRGLKRNNYDLALKLQTMKHDWKEAGDERVFLIEENYQLREKVISLETALEDSEQKFGVFVTDVKKIFKSLSTHMSHCGNDMGLLEKLCVSHVSSSSNQSESLHSTSVLDLSWRSVPGHRGDDLVQRPISTSPKTRSQSTSDICVNMEKSKMDISCGQFASNCTNKMSRKRKLSGSKPPQRIPLDDHRESGDGWPNLDADCEQNKNELSENSFIGNAEPPADIYNHSFTHVEEPPSPLHCTDKVNEQLNEVESTNQSSLSKTAKKDVTSTRKTNKDPHIINEFSLNVAHQRLTEKMDAAKQFESSVPLNEAEENKERTVCEATEMELTVPIDTTVFSTLGNHDLENFRETLTSTRSRGHTQILSDSSSSGDQEVAESLEELFPDVVTMRKLKPGQFKFAVGRKDSGGCRKEIPNNPTRARSKSKKQIAEMIEQLPQEEPKSIFDFHDKTPTFAPEKSHEVLSVYSLADESTNSPLTPLRKDKPVNTKCSQSISRKIIKPAESSQYDAEDKEYSEPLKDSPKRTSKIDKKGARSRSRGRVKKDKNIIEHSDENIPSNIDEPLESNIFLEKLISDSPVKTPNMSVCASRGRSRSRKIINRTEQNQKCSEDSIPDVTSRQLLISKETRRPTLLGEGVTYSETLKDSPPKSPKVNVRASRSQSQSRKTIKNDEKEHDSVEQSVNPIETEKSTLLSEGITYSEPLKNSSSKSLKVTVRASRSQSRSRKVIGNEEEHDSVERSANENPTLLGDSVTHSEPLKNKSTKSPKVMVKASRSRSRSRKVISTEKEHDHVEQSVNPNETEKSTLLGEGVIYSEPLKNNSPKSLKVMVTVKTSRGRIRSRKVISTEKGHESVEHSVNPDETEKPTLGGVIHSKPLKNSSPNSPNVTVKTHSRSRSRKAMKSTEKGHNSVEQSVNPNETQKLTLLGEGVTYSEPLKNSPAKSPKVVRASRSQSRSRKPMKSTEKEHDGVEHSANENEKPTLLGEDVTHSEPLKNMPSKSPKVMVKASRGRSRSRKVTCTEKDHDNVEQLANPNESEKPTLLGEGVIYSEPLKNSPAKSPKVTVRASRSQSRSRKPMKSAEKEDDSVEHSAIENEKPTLVGEGVTHSGPLKNRPTKSPKVMVKTSRGRSRSRKVISTEKENDSVEQSVNPNVTEKPTLLGEGVIYSEPLKNSPAKSPKVTVRASRSQSRSRKPMKSAEKEHDSVEHSANEYEKPTLVEGVTHSEPLKNRPTKSPKVMVNASRGRSRSRKVISTEKENDSVEQSMKPNVTEKPTLLGEGVTYSEPLKNSPSKSPKVTVRASRSQSRSRKPMQSNENEKPTLGEGGVTHSEPLKNRPTKSPKVMVKASRGRSRSWKVIEKEHDNVEQSVNPNETEKPTHLGEGIIYSEPLKNSPSESLKVAIKPSRSQSWSRKVAKDLVGAQNLVNNDISNSASDSRKDNTETISLLGKGITYSEVLNDSPIKSPKVTNEHSKSLRSRSVGQSLKGSDNDIKSRGRSKSRSRKLCSEKEVNSSSDEFGEMKQFNHEKEKLNADDPNFPNATHSHDVMSEIPETGNDLIVHRSKKTKKQEEHNMYTKPGTGKKKKHIQDSDTIKLVSAINNDTTDQTDTEMCEMIDHSKSVKKREGRKSRKQMNYDVDQHEMFTSLDAEQVGEDASTKKDDGVTGENTMCDKHIHDMCFREKDSTKNLKESTTVLDKSEKISEHKSSQSKIHSIKKRKRKVSVNADTGDDPIAKLKVTENTSFLIVSNEQDDGKENSTEISKEVKNVIPGCNNSNSSNAAACLKDGELEKDVLSPASLKREGSSNFREVRDSMSSIAERQSRRAKQTVSYAEPSIGKKLRRGDPFTSVMSGNDIKIYKSPKMQGKKKQKSSHGILESVQNSCDLIISE